MPPAAQPLSIPVHANQLGAVDEVCTAAIGCTQGDLMSQLLLLVATGLMVVVIIAAAVRVREALPALSEERSRTAAEQEAFSRFARAVSRLEATASTTQLGPTDGSTTAVSTTVPPSTRGLESVRAAYEETVLAMDHYEEEYDEPLGVNMRKELGEEVATAVEQNRELLPSLQQAIVERAREAAADRERLMRRLEDEQESLEAAEVELTAVGEAVNEAANRPLTDQSFRELTDEWHRLGELESRLDRLLARRQETRRATTVHGGGANRPSLRDYLYDGLDTRYPILADGAALVDRVKDVRRRVLLALTSRA